MTPIDLSRALVPAGEHEDVVKGRFWDKVRRTLGRVPFLEHAVSAYFAAVDPATPVRVKATLFAALAYFILPVDFVPDVIAGLGFSDDATVLFLALQAIAPHLTETHRERAHAALARTAPADRSAFFRQG